jgi:hypothetical protein
MKLKDKQIQEMLDIIQIRNDVLLCTGGSNIFPVVCSKKHDLSV